MTALACALFAVLTAGAAAEAAASEAPPEAAASAEPGVEATRVAGDPAPLGAEETIAAGSRLEAAGELAQAAALYRELAHTTQATPSRAQARARLRALERYFGAALTAAPSPTPSAPVDDAQR